MHQKLPHLGFLEGEILSEGSVIFPIDFSGIQKPFSMTYFKVDTGFSTPVDKHAVAECWVILNGRGELNYNGVTVIAEPQDIFYFSSFQSHQIKSISKEPLLICSIYWKASDVQ